MSIRKNVADKYKRVSRYFPAIAFFAGFLWDSFTLGRQIKPSDLYIIMAYYLGAGFCLFAMEKKLGGKWSKYIPLGLQFFLGGIFSALVVFYFKSSSHIWGYITVFLLLVFLVLNEFLADYYQKKIISWTLFTLCGTMFINFGLPHVFGSIHSIWFILSCLLALAITYGLKKLTRQNIKNLMPSVLGQIILVLFFIANIIPPVPLVQKNMALSLKIQKENNEYRATVAKKPWYYFLKPGRQNIQKPLNQPVSCFSSIFAPDGIETKIYHQWEYYNERQKSWQKRDKIGFQIKSGRSSGYRGYTYKNNIEDGLWKIKVELENGQILGIKKFRVNNLAASDSISTKTIVLN